MLWQFGALIYLPKNFISTIKWQKKIKINLDIKTSRGQKFVFGIFLILISVVLLLSFVSYFISGANDQSQVTELADRTAAVENWLGKAGAWLAQMIVYQGFGVASFLFVKIIFMFGAYLVVDIPLAKLRKSLFWDLFLVLNISILFGLLWDVLPFMSGVVGYEINSFL